MDIFAEYKTAMTKSFIFSDDGQLGYNDANYSKTSSSGCSKTELIVTIVIVVAVVLIIIAVVVIMRMKKKAKKEGRG